MTHMLVDTATGLRIVKATARNDRNPAYEVQFVGTLAECQAEKRRLEAR